MQVLLQSATGITNCHNRYYKLQQVLQIATVHTPFSNIIYMINRSSKKATF